METTNSKNTKSTALSVQPMALSSVTTTPNLQLEKPAETDFYDIGVFNANVDKIDAAYEDLTMQAALKSEVVFGTYTGDGTASRTINLGFTPVAVEVCDEMGRQYQFSGVRGIFGGIAVTGHPCASGSSNKAIEIVENGFNVAYNSEENLAKTNQGRITYYFIAYKNGQVMEVQ